MGYMFYALYTLSTGVYSAEPPKKRCQVTKAVRDQVKTRTHQKTFLESLQATPAVLHQNSDTKRCFDDDGRFAWLQHETYIKADAIEDCIVVCGCCSEAQVSKPKAKKRKPTWDSGKKNGLDWPSKDVFKNISKVD